MMAEVFYIGGLAGSKPAARTIQTMQNADSVLLQMLL